jgi:AcrR family transcriptional regulator
MRKLGQQLRVEAMSLYKHVASKDDLLDGMADLVTGDFEVPAADGDWRAAIRGAATSAHRVLLRHPWAGSLIESRLAVGPSRLRYLDGIIGVLRSAGFEMPLVVPVIMVLDSYTYGFVLQEVAWPFDAEQAPELAADFARGLPAGQYPNLLAMAELVTSSQGGVPVDFEFGLDLLLDGLERLLESSGSRSSGDGAAVAGLSPRGGSPGPRSGHSAPPSAASRR